MITAPYNFVPLNEKVFYPDWADKINHDIPFSDGESGEIEITITAKSPIFIRDHENPEEFCHVKNQDGSKQYYIPGSSIKGMIRNVLEIMSFSKMEFIDDKTYAVRDLSSADNFYMKKMNPEHIFCGWLRKDGNSYIIEDCGIPGRISHDDIDRAFEVDFASKFSPEKFDAKDDKQKTAKYKYNLLKNKDLKISVKGPFSSKKNQKYDKRKFYNYDPLGEKKAILVLTGQPTARKNNSKPGDGKGFEFLFFEKISELKLNEKVFENFLFAYFDGRNTQPKESQDWEYWKARLNKGEKVPVFFHKNGQSIESFGLSYLYKLPYKYSIKNGIPPTHFEYGLDLAQTMFGYIDSNNKTALKGRIFFSHFKADKKTVKKLQERTVVLGTPRASYYPNYIDQEGVKTGFKTYMDANFKIAGRKRYPIHKNGVKSNDNNENDKIGTTFIPLDKGVVFNGKVRYFNLKKAEVGALLSSLTFHGIKKEAFHSLGLAKPLGYGKIKLSINGIEKIEEYLKEFEKEISSQIEDWIDSTVLKELLSMAVEQNHADDSKLEYMSLEKFATYKTKENRSFLQRYTKFDNIDEIKLESMLTKDEIKKAALKREEFEKRRYEYLQKIKKEQEYKRELKHIKNSTNISQLKAFLQRYPNCDQENTIQKKIAFLTQEQELKTKRKKEEEERRKRAIEEKKAEEEKLKREEEERKKAERLSKGLDFSDAKDIGDIERALKGFDKSEENKHKLKEAIKEIYPTLNKKKKGKFLRSKDLKKWIDKDSLKKLLDSLDNI